jgi:hypothetical protein
MAPGRSVAGVGKPRKNTMHSANTVELDTHVAATLRYIRASGVIGLVATVVSLIPAMRPHWLIVWLVAAVVAAVAGGALLFRQVPVRRFAIALLPSLFAGAVMTAVLWSSDNLRAIPGIWLLLYGCGLIAASTTTGRSIGILGGSFVATGLLALVLPESLQIPLLGVGFGGLHIVFGYLMYRAGYGGET